MLLNIFLLILVFTAICLFQIPGLIQEKQWRDLIVFLALLVPALILSLLNAAGVKLPFIIPAIYSALTPLLTWLGLS